MRKKPWITVVLLALALAALVWWQHKEYLLERELARETLQRQSHSVMNALVGGIRSHRRRGRFFVDQLQGSLEGLVNSEDILAVAVTSERGIRILSAGETDLLPAPSLMIAGDVWDADHFCQVELFELPPATGGLRERSGGGHNRPDRGQGRSGHLVEPSDADNPFATGGTFAAILVLDRSSLDARCRHAMWLRGWVVTAGAMLLFAVTVTWRLTVNAAGRERMLETEARHLRDLSQAAAGLAHETRNPLGLIRGWAQRLVQHGFSSPEQQAHAESIVEECDRVTSRINQFLAFARPREPTLEAVDVKELADSLAILLESDLAEKELTIDRQSIESGATVHADREMLRQALFNLVQNAIHAAPTGTVVEMSFPTGQDGKGRIEVANRGAPVPDEVVGSLFTPYFTTRPDGTGLGLAIVRHIAGVHGWDCGYTARAGGGALFWLDGLHE